MRFSNLIFSFRVLFFFFTWHFFFFFFYETVFTLNLNTKYFHLLCRWELHLNCTKWSFTSVQKDIIIERHPNCTQMSFMSVQTLQLHQISSSPCIISFQKMIFVDQCADILIKSQPRHIFMFLSVNSICRYLHHVEFEKGCW